MHQKPGRYALVCILMAALATSASADPGTGAQNDAGAGGDAGDIRANATAVKTSVKYGGSLRPNDVDWFAAAIDGSAATCVVARVHASAPTYFALGAEDGSGARAAPFAVGPGQEGVGGVAGISPLTATLRVAQASGSSNFGSYDFRLDRVGAPSAGGDGGTTSDAGDSTSSAVAAAPGCTQGRLGVLDGVDLRDVYSIRVGVNEVVTYSLGATDAGISLTLLDALGEAVGPTLQPGQAASVSTSSSGTYYMSTARTTGVGDIGYTTGAIVGPEPSGCRPYCLG